MRLALQRRCSFCQITLTSCSFKQSQFFAVRADFDTTSLYSISHKFIMLAVLCWLVANVKRRGMNEARVCEYEATRDISAGDIGYLRRVVDH